MAKKLTSHFTSIEELHIAVKTVAVSRKLDMNELVMEVLLKDPAINAVYKKVINN